MKKKNNESKVTAKQFADANRQAVTLGKSIVAQQGKVLTEWLALGRLVVIAGIKQADIIKTLAKSGVKMDKADLSKAVVCAKWNTSKKFTSLNAMYASAPRKQKSGKRKAVKKNKAVVTKRKAIALANKYVPKNKRAEFVRALGITA